MDFNEIVGCILNFASSAGATDNTGSGQHILPAGSAGSGQEWLSGGSGASGQQQRCGPATRQQWQPTGSRAGQKRLPAVSGLSEQWMPDASGQGRQRLSAGSGSVQPWTAERLRTDQQRLSYGSAGSIQQQRPQLLRDAGSGSGQQRLYRASANSNLQNTLHQPQVPSDSVNSTLQQALCSVTQERGMSLSERERQSVVQSVLARLAAAQKTNHAPSLNPINPDFDNSAISLTSVDSLLNLIRNQAPVIQRDTSIDSARSKINAIVNPTAATIDYGKSPSFTGARLSTAATSGYSGRGESGLDFPGISLSKLDERREDLPPPPSYPKIINEVDPDDFLEFSLTKSHGRESRRSPDRREEDRSCSRSPDRGGRTRRSGSRSRRCSRSRNPLPHRYSGRNPDNIQIVRDDYDRAMDTSRHKMLLTLPVVPVVIHEQPAADGYMTVIPCEARKLIKDLARNGQKAVGRPIIRPGQPPLLRRPDVYARVLEQSRARVEELGRDREARQYTRAEKDRIWEVIKHRISHYATLPKNKNIDSEQRRVEKKRQDQIAKGRAPTYGMVRQNVRENRHRSESGRNSLNIRRENYKHHPYNDLMNAVHQQNVATSSSSSSSNISQRPSTRNLAASQNRWHLNTFGSL